VDDRREFLERVLDLSPGIVFVADPLLVITYVNRAATALLGYEREEILGRSVVEFLDTDWNPEAFASIATALGSEGGQRPPMTFRAVTKDGRRPIIEATANLQLHDPVINGLVDYVRPRTERWLLDRAFETVAAGVSIDRTMALLVEVAGAETLEADAAFVFDPAGGTYQHVIAADTLPAELHGPADDVDAATAEEWTTLLAEGRPFTLNLDDLPPALRRLAVDHGYRSLWAAPADASAAGGATVWALAWRRELHLDADETRTAMMARLATLAGLALARSRNELQNAYAASHDAMTGLWNRNAIYAWLAAALGTGGPAAGEVAVIYLDLDRFKPVNDTFGHAAGDRVLREVADRLMATAPAEGRVGRFGGDEFVYVGRVSDAAELARVEARLAEAIAAPIELRSGEAVTVGVSTGAASAAPGRRTADELVELADAALYRVKETRSGGEARRGS
jgi:diguanylate cyclase (GGDEF)-like protein/PAS domain S-box-containing protein